MIRSKSSKLIIKSSKQADHELLLANLSGVFAKYVFLVSFLCHRGLFVFRFKAPKLAVFFSNFFVIALFTSLSWCQEGTSSYSPSVLLASLQSILSILASLSYYSLMIALNILNLRRWHYGVWATLVSISFLNFCIMYWAVKYSLVPSFVAFLNLPVCIVVDLLGSLFQKLFCAPSSSSSS